jgi:hypothetical protein
MKRSNFLMPDKTDHMRSLNICANSEDALIEKLGKIPGYSREPLEPEAQKLILGHTTDSWFYLVSEDCGERIVVCHKAGDATARTINVVDQDQLDHPPLFHDDEIVKLRGAIAHVEDLFVQLNLAEVDRTPPRT